MKKKYNKTLLVVIILLFISISINFLFLFKLYVEINKNNTVNDNDTIITSTDFEESDVVELLDKINLVNTNKLMIVAHPDDEILWGGGHLIDENYLVICVTCGTREKRESEFSEVMYQTHDSYLSLGYPDKTNNVVDSWDKFHLDIQNDLEDIINYKDWEVIVTHNPEGEYGHIHHKLINGYVRNVSVNKNLFYFGKYYDSDQIKEIDKTDWFKLDKKTYQRKETIEEYYVSQRGAIAMYKHIDMYENWISASEWNDDLFL